MHFPLLSLLALPLALTLALPAFENPGSHLPKDFEHLLPSIPGTEEEILADTIATLTAQRTAMITKFPEERGRWLLLGVRAASAGEEWGFIAVFLRSPQEHFEFTAKQYAAAVAPGANHFIDSKLGWVVWETRHRLVPLKTFSSINMFTGAPFEARLAYETNSPRDVWYWYDQFFRAMGIDVSQGGG